MIILERSSIRHIAWEKICVRRETGSTAALHDAGLDEDGQSSCNPRSPKARDRGHPPKGAAQRAERSGEPLRMPERRVRRVSAEKARQPATLCFQQVPLQ